jgi:hypothetical protein
MSHNAKFHLPWRFNEMFDNIPVQRLMTYEWAIMERILKLSGDVEENPGPTALTVENILHVAQQFSYNDVMTKLKPVVTISSLLNILESKSLKVTVAEVIKLLEAHNLFWSFDTETLTQGVDILLNFLCAVEDLPNLIKNFVSDEHRYSFSSGLGLESQCLTINDGVLKNATSFLKKFDIPESIISDFSGSFVIAGTAIFVLALMGCGTSMSKSKIGNGFSVMMKTMASECRDLKVILTSFSDTWKFLMSHLGQFLGFTYLDEKSEQRTLLIKRMMDLKEEIEKLENSKDFDFETYSDPLYFAKFDMKIKEMNKLLEDIMRFDQNVVTFRIELDKLRDRVQKFKEETTSLFQSRCGKQQPTTIWVGSDKSGIGKTTVMGWFAEQISDVTGNRLTVYTRNSLEKYWSNYVWQDVVHIQDFSQCKSNEEHNELINIYGPQSYQLPMADSEEKGRQFKSRFVFIDSNQIFIRRSEMVDDPSKLDRRRDFLFEAHTDFVSDPRDNSKSDRPDTRESALKHLILEQLNPLGHGLFDANPAETVPLKKSIEFFTIDGRDVKVYGKVQKTKLFSELVAMFISHEQKNRQAYKTLCLIERQKGLLIKEKLLGETLKEQATTPAVGVLASDKHPVFVLVGPPGCGKTTLAKTFRMDDSQDDFLTKPNSESYRSRILNVYDTGSETLVLTTNVEDLKTWKNTLQQLGSDKWEAVERRCIFVNAYYKRKKGWTDFMSYYTYQDVEKFPSDYNKMVGWMIDDKDIPYTDLGFFIKKKT